MGGLLQLGVRFLDPSVGRFTQVDPVRDGANWYAYVENNPLSGIDPSGKIIVQIVAITAEVICAKSALNDARRQMEEIEKETRNRRYKKVRSDLWGHCYLMCKVRRCFICDPLAARAALWHIDSRHSKNDSDYKVHRDYNHAGFKFGAKKTDCRMACLSYALRRGMD